MDGLELRDRLRTCGAAAMWHPNRGALFDGTVQASVDDGRRKIRAIFVRNGRDFAYGYAYVPDPTAPHGLREVWVRDLRMLVDFLFPRKA